MLREQPAPMNAFYIPPYVERPQDSPSPARHERMRAAQATASRPLPIQTQAVPASQRASGGGVGADRDNGPLALRHEARQLSRSHYTPRTIDAYVGRLRSIRVEGYLERRSRRQQGTWRRRWFLLRDGALSSFRNRAEAEADDDPEKDGEENGRASGGAGGQQTGSRRLIPLHRVEAVRTEDEFGPWAFRVISSDREDLVLRAASRDDFQSWLFGFHCILGSIIARLLEAGYTHSPGGLRGGRGQGGGGAAGGGAAGGGIGASLVGGSAGAGDGDGSSAGGEGSSGLSLPSDGFRKVLGHGHGREKRRALQHEAADLSSSGWKSAEPMLRKRLSASGLLVPQASDDGGDGGAAEEIGNTSSFDYGEASMEGEDTSDDAGCSRSSRCATDVGIRGMPARDFLLYADAERPAPAAPRRGVSAGNGSDRGAGKSGGLQLSPPPQQQQRQQQLLQGQPKGSASPKPVAAPQGRLPLGGLLGGLLGVPTAGGSSAPALAGGTSAPAAAPSSWIYGDDDSYEELKPTMVVTAVEDLDFFRDDGGEGYVSDSDSATPPQARGGIAGSLGVISGGSCGGSGSIRPPPRRQAAAAAPADSDSSDDDLAPPGVPALAMAMAAGMDAEPHSLVAPRPTRYIPPALRAREAAAAAAAAAAAGGGRPPPARTADASGSGAASVKAPSAGRYVPPALRNRPPLPPPSPGLAAAARAAAFSPGPRLTAASPPPGGDSGDEDMFTLSFDEFGGDMAAAAAGVAMPLPRAMPPGSGAAGRISGGSLAGRAAATATLPPRAAPLPPPAAAVKPVVKPAAAATAAAAARPMPWAGTPEEGAAAARRLYTGEEHNCAPCQGGSTCNTGVGGEDRRQGGLWWTCGVYSIMGRREKQEDRHSVLPRYSTPATSPTRTRGGVDKSGGGSSGGGSSGGGSGGSSQTAEASLSDASPVSAATAAATFDGESGPELPAAVAVDAGAVSSVSMAVAAVDEEEESGFFGVYDGHCGFEAAQFISDRLHVTLEQHAAFAEDPREALRSALLHSDRDFLALCNEHNWYCGTTVLAALLRGKRLLVANLGDCEAVLCRGGRAEPMSLKHKPDRDDEEARILLANGWVTRESELFLRQLRQMDLQDPNIRNSASEHVKWTTITRLCGELSVSRAVGDRDFKGFTRRRQESGTRGVPPIEACLFNWPREHSGEFYDDLVLAEPDFCETTIEPQDSFLLLACDGLWDVLSMEEAVEHASRFFKEGRCAQAVSQKMCELAYRMGTSDNVTAVVVKFHHEPRGWPMAGEDPEDFGANPESSGENPVKMDRGMEEVGSTSSGTNGRGRYSNGRNHGGDRESVSRRDEAILGYSRGSCSDGEG